MNNTNQISESNDYKIEIDFLDYCYSFKNDIDWNLILISVGIEF